MTGEQRTWCSCWKGQRRTIADDVVEDDDVVEVDVVVGVSEHVDIDVVVGVYVVVGLASVAAIGVASPAKFQLPNT